MKTLTTGQEVRFLPTGQLGTIEQTYNDGKAGLFRTGRQVFTVLADECESADEPSDPLDRLFAMNFTGCKPATIFRKEAPSSRGTSK